MENLFKVYKHTNLINKRIYIGITYLPINKRWVNGKGYKKQQFYSAILEFGWDNFKHEVLFDKLTEDEALEIEKELILFHKSYLPEFGYNIDMGGKYAGKHSIETRNKISKNVPHRKIICLETKEIFNSGLEASIKMNLDYSTLMRVCKGRYRNKSVNGYHFIYLEEYDKNKIYNLDINCGLKVICLENKKIFKSATDAGKQLKLDISSVCKVCNGKKMSVGGLHFKYLKDYKEDENYELYSDRDLIKKKIICIETGEKFASIKEAGYKMGLRPNAICAVLRKRQNTTGGYTFKYLD